MSEFTVLGETDIPQDKTPPTDDYTPETDEGFDSEAPYGRTPTGRIRKRPVGSTTRGAKGGGGKNSNQALATQAAALLAQTNGLLCTGLMLARMGQTASALAQANEGFEEQVAAALITDPALCRTILRAGGTSAKMSLIIAYVMLGAAVAPVGYMEYREIRSSRIQED